MATLCERAACLFLILFPLIFIDYAWSAPPFVADDTEPVEYGHTEFYLASVIEQSNGGRSGALPFFEMNYGGLENVHFHVGTPLAYSQSKNSSAHFGYGDTEFGFKYRFIREDADTPAVAIFPQINIPTGNESNGLGSGHNQVFLPIWVQKEFGVWNIYGGGGWWRNPGLGRKDYFRSGIVASRSVGEDLSLGLEIFYESPRIADGTSHTAVNFGFTYPLNSSVSFLGSVGRDIEGGESNFLYAGIQYLR